MISILKKELHIDFINRRGIAYIVSIVAIITGMTVFFIRGEKNFGIDFTGGLIMERSFTAPVTTGAIRSALAEINLGESTIQESVPRAFVLHRDASADKKGESGEGTVFLIRTTHGVSSKIDDKLKERFGDKIDPENYVIRTDMVGPSIGHELRQKATIAVIISWIAIIVYVSIRYRLNFAVAGVFALIHDVLITVGAFALSGREINYPVIAALLVIVGYSINDTIVIYDRIRENMKLKKNEATTSLLNLSINQTLSRTILTTFATLLSVAVLFIIGGAAIKDFAFALLVGMISGVYSTIYVACSLIASWEGKRNLRVPERRPAT